jgi:hypothetical protein
MLSQHDIYSAACPEDIVTWFFISFANFYGLQLLIYCFFKTKSRKLSLTLFLLTSFCLVPGMLTTNLWGNLIIEQMDNNPECTYTGYA